MDRGLSLCDYEAYGNYYLYATGDDSKHVWTDASGVCSDLGLTFMNVNSDEKAAALMGSSFGDY